MQNIDMPVLRPIELVDIAQLDNIMFFGSFSLNRVNYEPCFNGALSAKYLLCFEVHSPHNAEPPFQ